MTLHCGCCESCKRNRLGTFHAQQVEAGVLRSTLHELPVAVQLNQGVPCSSTHSHVSSQLTRRGRRWLCPPLLKQCQRRIRGSCRPRR